jgi:hypothetical protein
MHGRSGALQGGPDIRASLDRGETDTPEKAARAIAHDLCLSNWSLLLDRRSWSDNHLVGIRRRCRVA